MNYGFKRRYRIKKRDEFLNTLVAQSVMCSLGRVYYKSNNMGFPRVGIIVSRFVGGAVFRNRLKRLVREYFRVRKDMLGAWDIVIRFKRQFKNEKGKVYRELSRLEGLWE